MKSKQITAKAPVKLTKVSKQKRPNPRSYVVAGQTVEISSQSLPEKLDWLKKTMEDVVKLSFEKAVLHRENPSLYPLSNDPRSIENAFHELLNVLPSGKRKIVVNKVNETLKANASQRKSLYKELVEVDFKATKPIAEQVVKLATVAARGKFDQAEIDELEAIKQKLAPKQKRKRRPNKAKEFLGKLPIWPAKWRL